MQSLRSRPAAVRGRVLQPHRQRLRQHRKKAGRKAPEMRTAPGRKMPFSRIILQKRRAAPRRKMLPGRTVLPRQKRLLRKRSKMRRRRSCLWSIWRSGSTTRTMTSTTRPGSLTVRNRRTRSMRPWGSLCRAVISSPRTTATEPSPVRSIRREESETTLPTRLRSFFLSTRRAIQLWRRPRIMTVPSATAQSQTTRRKAWSLLLQGAEDGITALPSA